MSCRHGFERGRCLAPACEFYASTPRTWQPKPLGARARELAAQRLSHDEIARRLGVLVATVERELGK
ncbi:MAG: hypothetical protein IT377_27815 [Polyangiaceae bacterium]|nr:hypothetical protein [Polyangiaceae bacterium]